MKEGHYLWKTIIFFTLAWTPLKAKQMLLSSRFVIVDLLNLNSYEKKLSFKFVKSEVTSFLDTVRSYSDDNCTSICFALEVTGIYSTNVYNFIKANLNDNESIRFLNNDFINQWRKNHNIAK